MATEIGVNDVAGVRSRVSWPAVFGGSVAALAVYLVLTLLFAAIGLSVTDINVRAGNVATGALIAGVLSVVLGLFAGGWVTAQLTVGETKREAAIYGLLTWAVVTTLSVILISNGLRTGYNAMLGATLVAQDQKQADGRSWEEIARASGVPQERIEQAKAGLDPERLKAAAQDPATQEKARQGAATATWLTLAGTVLSIAAAAAGALVGSGPSFRLFPVAAASVRRETVMTS